MHINVVARSGTFCRSRLDDVRRVPTVHLSELWFEPMLSSKAEVTRKGRTVKCCIRALCLSNINPLILPSLSSYLWFILLNDYLWFILLRTINLGLISI